MLAVKWSFWTVQSIFIDFLNETTDKSRDCSLIFVHILDAIAAFPLDYLWVYVYMPWMVVFTFTFFFHSSVHDTKCCSYIPLEMNENAIIIITIIIMHLHLTNIYIYEKKSTLFHNNAWFGIIYVYRSISINEWICTHEY